MAGIEPTIRYQTLRVLWNAEPRAVYLLLLLWVLSQGSRKSRPYSLDAAYAAQGGSNIFRTVYWRKLVAAASGYVCASRREVSHLLRVISRRRRGQVLAGLRFSVPLGIISSHSKGQCKGSSVRI